MSYQNLRKRFLFCLIFVAFCRSAWAQNVHVTLSDDPRATEIAPRFLGFSYESREMLPKNGKYYFDAHDARLVRLYRTLGIKSLRVGANAVDDPKVAVPDTKDIDALFAFARAAGVKVIYSFRLRNGDPANAARLAAYITTNYSDCLDCFSIGNEPNYFVRPYQKYSELWKPEYEAILKAVPDAMFDGPSAGGNDFAVQFADEFVAAGHIAIVSTHSYPLGNGRDAEKHLAKTRDRFVSNAIEIEYQKIYDQVCVPLAKKNIPYRMDETNSCYHGGGKGCSDAYASTLWALDYLNWWAAHGIVGINFHTGETIDGFPPLAANYAAFVHEKKGKDFQIRPQSYALLAFSAMAHGKPMRVKIDAPGKMNFNAYAYQDGSTIYVTAMNKSYGHAAEIATVTLQLPAHMGKGSWARMELEQKSSDIAAKTGVSIGGSHISPRGRWDGKWTNLKDADPNLTLTIEPASVALLRFMSAK